MPAKTAAVRVDAANDQQKPLTAEEVAVEAAAVVSRNAARLGMDSYATTYLVVAIRALA